MGKINALDIEEYVGWGVGLSTTVAIGVLAFGSLGGTAVDLDKQIGTQETVITTAIKTQQDYLGQLAPDCHSALVETMKAKPDVDAASFSGAVDRMVVCGKTAQLIAVTYFNQQSDIKAARQKEANLQSERSNLYGNNISGIVFLDIAGSVVVGKIARFVTSCIVFSQVDKNKARIETNPVSMAKNEPKVEKVEEVEEAEAEEATKELDGIFRNPRQSPRHWQTMPIESGSEQVVTKKDDNDHS